MEITVLITEACIYKVGPILVNLYPGDKIEKYEKPKEEKKDANAWIFKRPDLGGLWVYTRWLSRRKQFLYIAAFVNRCQKRQKSPL